MNTAPASVDFVLEPADNERLANLCGQFDQHLRQIERRLSIQINSRGSHFRVVGEGSSVQAAVNLLRQFYGHTKTQTLNPEHIHIGLQESSLQALAETDPQDDSQQATIKTRRGLIHARGHNQERYVHNIHALDLNFGIGPAGTGKTYLAVGCAVQALEAEEVRRIVLVRPAVEAGERLGFLPGDMSQKVDPYLRPIYDALYEMLGFDRVGRLVDRNVIEIAPLAYMRGRTLNESFIILDEAQNTTTEQMKMFLTRIGFGAKAVVTGDVTQTDLPEGRASGLQQVVKILSDMDGVAFTIFTARDVVRHTLVKKIVRAYEAHEAADKRSKHAGATDPE